MIICHYGHNIGAQGGISSYVNRVSQAQRELGYEVHILSCFSDIDSSQIDKSIIVVSEDAVYDTAKRLGADILHTHCTLRYPVSGDLAVFRTLHGHVPYCPSGSKFMSRTEKPCDREYSLAGCFLGHMIGRCGSVRPSQIADNFRTTWTEMSVLKGVSVIAVSHFLRDRMIEAGYNPDNIDVLHLTAPSSTEARCFPDSKQARFLFLGRITHNKGLSWLLHAFGKLKYNAHLDIAGEGQQLDSMVKLTETLGISDKVTFHGWTSSEKVQQLMKGARALVIPSLWHEPGGTVAFESMMNSRAVISSTVGGMPEVIKHGINGLIVKPNDVDELVQSLERLCLNPQEAEDFGRTGYDIAISDFSLKRHIELLDKIYRKKIV
jgi:glycosyltransferase involved in cell wall biosynthesis